MAERSRLRVHALAALVAAALLLPTLWLAQAHLSVSREVAELDIRRQALATGAQPLADGTRGVVRRAGHARRADVSIVDRPHALDLLTHLARHLPADGSRITRLEWDGSRLRLALAVPPGTARIAYVDALEGGGWLRNVREDSQDAAPGAVVLAAELPPRARRRRRRP
jgi:Tfp pilus assembly protein PilN